MSIYDRLDGLLANLDQPCQLETLQQVNSLAPLFVLEQPQVVGQRHAVILSDLLDQFCSVVVSLPGLLDKIGNLRLYS